jgi:hypothetical protein
MIGWTGDCEQRQYLVTLITAPAYRGMKYLTREAAFGKLQSMV